MRPSVSTVAASGGRSASWAGDFLLLSSLWGASFLFMRLGASEFGPLAMAGLRVSIAALFLTVLLLRSADWALFRQHWRAALLAGVVNSAIPFALYAWAVLYIPTGLSSILNATVPLFGALVAMLWLGERITGLRWLGLALGFAGVALLAWRMPMGGARTAAWAIGACLAASTCYAVGASFVQRYLRGVPPLACATGSQIGATLALALPTIWAWPQQAPSGQAWAAVAALALLCTGIAYLLYFRIIARAGPSRALAVTFLAPVFAVCYGALFLGEEVTAWMVGCGAVVVCGTMLSTGFIGGRKARVLPPG